MAQEKAKYRILRLSFIGNQLLDEGAEIEYDGEPGSALEPLNDAAKAAKKKAEQKAEQKRGKSTAADGPAPVPSVLNPVVQNPEGPIAGANGEGGDGTGAVSEELTALRQQYEDLFNEKPGNMKAETLQDRIAKKRAELGL
ncbi:hypothetical protein MSU89_001953 [Cronobacter sakazakii]|uniref:hypothetical protein n=1 Tax=Cronobacter sakazakii TaxID=28141 RepID=UPI000CFAC209|nr:hypothetical protein [Cronobacter sakazakii]EGT4949789.1 hypothetical protein [Cronobacter sakazakii]EIZ2209971.1 hypothetical protein [Cronobacter sakazakii]EIZ2214412.1 hypothetical protein [Cronobacter sakazakii]EIZ2218835.1 hypothetical protein [Cronobacter sakazakii]EIZ3630277.1 hypothetical protein [Cronobacter sakazakii]